MWFGMLGVCIAEREWAEPGTEDCEVHDGDNVKEVSMLGEPPMWQITLPYKKGCIELHICCKGASNYYWQNSLGVERGGVGLAWQECTRMSLRDLVLWEAVMGWLGQMFCTCESFSVICQRLRTDWEKYHSCGEYGFTIGRTVLGLAAMRRVVQEGVTGVEESFWRCCE